MTQLATKNPTLIDVARILDPSGKVDRVVNILQNYNEILDDIPVFESNLPTGHLITQLTSKPTPYFRLLNAGIVPQKSTTGQITEDIAMMENRNQIDKDIAELNGNTEAFRLSQDKPMIEGFSDLLASKLIYGDSSVVPEEFNGLATRFFSLGTTYPTYTQVIDAGGTGSDNTSMYLVNWGADKVYTVYPKGSKAGLQYEDLGLKDVLTNATTGAIMRAYASWMQWKIGLVVANYLNIVRIANIDVSALLTASDASDTSTNLLKWMTMAIDLLPPGGGGTPVFYANNTVRGMLRVKLMDKSNFALSIDDITGPTGIGRKQLSFFGIPVRRVDALLKTESQITTHTT